MKNGKIFKFNYVKDLTWEFYIDNELIIECDTGYFDFFTKVWYYLYDFLENEKEVYNIHYKKDTFIMTVTKSKIEKFTS